MLTARARRYLDRCQRWPQTVSTAEVERYLLDAGLPCPAAWLAFHDRYAGHVEEIYRDVAMWGLAHPASTWFADRRVEVDVEDGAAEAFCAELHPSYYYVLDDAGRFLGTGVEADSFDAYVERLALWREFRDVAPVWLDSHPDPRQRREILAGVAQMLVPEASDTCYHWYATPTMLIVDDPQVQALRKILHRQ